MKNKQDNTNLVSVVIPVYNVDKYLKRCVDSILRQNYVDLDIILIDDGSTDGSGDICDYYARNDKRVSVVHKLNGGLSDARNAGLALARGRYIHFLDSDDFIANDAIELLYNSIKFHEADIATFGYVEHHREDSDVSSYETIKNIQSLLSTEEALSKLLYEDTITTSACMKLYKRELFSSDIHFPVNKLCEDLGTVYKLFSNAKKIVINTVPKYYYYQRSGSIIQSEFTVGRMDGLYFASEQLEFVSGAYPALTAAAQCRLFVESIYIVMKMPLSRSLYREERNVALKVINQHKRSVLFNRKVRLSMRRRALVAFFGAQAMVYFFKAGSFVRRSIMNVVN